MQLITQDSPSPSARRDSFVVAAPEKVPVIQIIVTPTVYGIRGALTPRETDILELLGTGLSMKGVARGLGISAGTVKWHMKNIYEKLSASSREDALFKARQRQLIR